MEEVGQAPWFVGAFAFVIVLGAIVVFNAFLDSEAEGALSTPSPFPSSSTSSLPSLVATTSTTSTISNVFATPTTSTIVQTPTPFGIHLLPDLGVVADLRGFRPFPEDNEWNKDISAMPVDPRSDAIINRIGRSVHVVPDFASEMEYGIPYVVVSGDDTRFPVVFEYEDESDPGPYPIPLDAPIEGGRESEGDRHVIALDRDNLMLYELYAAYPDRVQGRWSAVSGAVFNLSSNALRPAGWTSADAAGLPIFPGLVKYSEVMRGEIAHALRVTMKETRRAFVCPARHWASRLEDEDVPPMGARFRLKEGFDESEFSHTNKVILRALKKYGLILSDNGGSFYITGAPDPRWDDDELRQLRRLTANDFEVVHMPHIAVPRGAVAPCQEK